MRTETVEIKLFEKGDRVITSKGTGIVMKDQLFKTNRFEEIFVKLDELTCNGEKKINFSADGVSIDNNIYVHPSKYK